jgi:hypothetical protein
MNARPILPYQGKALVSSCSLLLTFLLLLQLQPTHIFAQCGSCDYTEANLAGSTPIDIIPAGKTLCITSNYCLGTNANYPGTCGHVNSGHLTINGTLRICTGITFGFDGTINGSGNIEIMAGGRMSLYGTYDCNIHMTAIDPSLLSGQTSTTSSLSGSCNSTACEPTFSDGYAPFGVVSAGLGYTVNNGSCAITGVSNLIVLPIELLNWNVSWKGTAIQLTWSAPGYDQSSGYEIDHSADGQSWSALTQLSGANAPGINWYSYLAKGPWGTRNFFRIRHTSADGQASFSPVKELDANTKDDDGFFVGPNPVHSILLIRPDDPNQHFSVQLFDMTGKPVLPTASGTNGQYNIENLLAGSYFLVLIKDDGRRIVKKITKL